MAAEATAWHNGMYAATAADPVDTHYVLEGDLNAQNDFLSGDADYLISGVPFQTHASTGLPGGNVDAIAAPIMPSGLGALVVAPLTGFQVIKLNSTITYGPVSEARPAPPDGTPPTACPPPGCPPINVPDLNLVAMVDSYAGTYQQDPNGNQWADDYWSNPPGLRHLGPIGPAIQRRRGGLRGPAGGAGSHHPVRPQRRELLLRALGGRRRPFGLEVCRIAPASFSPSASPMNSRARAVFRDWPDPARGWHRRVRRGRRHRPGAAVGSERPVCDRDLPALQPHQSADRRPVDRGPERQRRLRDTDAGGDRGRRRRRRRGRRGPVQSPPIRTPCMPPPTRCRAPIP